MTRQEFLHELRIALQGEINQAAVNEHVNYYENYIIEESRKGRSEEEVITQLGNPRLIAKTLIDTTGQFGQTSGEQYYSEHDTSGTIRNEKGFHTDFSQNKGRVIRYGKILQIIIAALLIIIAANVVAFLLPIMVPVILIFIVISLIRGNRR